MQHNRAMENDMSFKEWLTRLISKKLREEQDRERAIRRVLDADRWYDPDRERDEASRRHMR